MVKVVINKSIGAFSVSREVVIRLREMNCHGAFEEVLEGEHWSDGELRDLREDHYFLDEVERDDPRLIAIIEELGERASPDTELKIIEIPDDVEWYVDESDCGVEFVREKHRIWS
jgi:hypothetical protein